MRRKLVVANRKMNGDLASNQAFLQGLLSGTKAHTHADYIVCMPHPYLFQAQTLLRNSPIAWGGQNMSRYQSGAYTGSVSPNMLTEFGCQYVIIGHSERRQRGHDTDASTGERFNTALQSGLTPIFCMGETLQEYEDGATDIITIQQLNAVIKEIGIEKLAGGILAYEPVWAIGTGKAATPQHAQNVLSFLRGHIEMYNAELAQNIRILYGGSVNANNAAELFSKPDIDGGLIGTACLNTQEFVTICQIASQINEPN
jgi:triosephosphate isomerase (TIM)